MVRDFNFLKDLKKISKIQVLKRQGDEENKTVSYDAGQNLVNFYSTEIAAQGKSLKKIRDNHRMKNLTHKKSSHLILGDWLFLPDLAGK